MPLRDLASMSLADFIEKHRGQADTLWFFQHIPKTAGSSFSTELRKRNRPYRNICVDYTDVNTPHEQKISKAVDDFLEMSKEVAFRSASGHLPMEQTQRLVDAYDDCRVVTFLRQPEARVISDYRYQRTPMHPPHQQFIQDFPTLESYIESSESHNKMAVFLLGEDGAKTAEEAVEKVGGSHVFIGLLEMYPMSFNIMFNLMGHRSLWPTEHVRKTPDDETTRVEITPQIKDMIRRSNVLDQAIYDYVRGLLVGHRQEFRKLTEAKTA